jgi:hypothetical protein
MVLLFLLSLLFLQDSEYPTKGSLEGFIGYVNAKRNKFILQED